MPPSILTFWIVTKVFRGTHTWPVGRHVEKAYIQTNGQADIQIENREVIMSTCFDDDLRIM